MTSGTILGAVCLVFLMVTFKKVLDMECRLSRMEDLLRSLELLVRCRIVPVMTSASWVDREEKEG